MVSKYFSAAVTGLTSHRTFLALYGALLLVLALYKAAVIWKENSGLHNFELVKVLVRDQAVYFLLYVYSSAVPLRFSYDNGICHTG